MHDSHVGPEWDLGITSKEKAKATKTG